MILNKIAEDLQKRFNINFKYYIEEDSLYIKCNGIDSVSLAKYIVDLYEVDTVSVSKNICRFIMDRNYIKITKGNAKILQII